MLRIVGLVSTPEEAKEITMIAKRFVVGNRARLLSRKVNKHGSNSK